MKTKHITGTKLPEVLFLIFLILKLTGNIDWSWWWVTSPVWIPIALGVAIGVVMGVVLAIGKTINSYCFFDLDYRSRLANKQISVNIFTKTCFLGFGPFSLTKLDSIDHDLGDLIDSLWSQNG